jgi:hypothetical protein
MTVSLYALNDLPKKLNATILNQGDSWTNNIMFRLAEDGSVMDEIAAIIDWQIIFESKFLLCLSHKHTRLANPFHDIARFMCICADGDVRREVERKAVDLMYDITSEGVEKMAYTREQVIFC